MNQFHKGMQEDAGLDLIILTNCIANKVEKVFYAWNSKAGAPLPPYICCFH